jgi:hypothetical protein
MELIILGPVTMAVGAILLHMSIDRQRKPRVEAAMAEAASAIEINPPKRDRVAAAEPPQPGRAGNLTAADLLLADTLTELLNVKQQLASLQTQVDALGASTPEPRQLELLDGCAANHEEETPQA